MERKGGRKANREEGKARERERRGEKEAVITVLRERESSKKGETESLEGVPVQTQVVS